MVSYNLERPSHNPNFPKHLSIRPSAVPISLSANYPSDARDLDAHFGSAAQEVAIKRYGIAGRVWEAAYAMILYIQPPQSVEFDPPFVNAEISATASKALSIIELGSGTGLVASTLLRLLDPLRDHVIATDLPEVCPLLQANLCPVSTLAGPPQQSHVTIMPLSWGNHEDVLALMQKIGALTHIICSDLVYFPELLAPLLRSLLHLSSPPFGFPALSTAHDRTGPTVVISYKLRSLVKEMPFWSAFGLWFNFFPVLYKDKSTGTEEWTRFGSDFDDMTFVFVARRRPESFDWKIPLLDAQLIAGFGAHGTDTAKGDDTFEAMLFMCLDQY